MKYIILLVMFSIFMLGCSSGKSLRSAGEEWAIPEIFSITEFKEAIVINQETGELCSIDLRKRGDLQLPFVSNVARDDGKDFREVSILKDSVACDVEKEQTLASLVPEAVYGELSEEAMAGVGSFLGKAGSHVLSCVLGTNAGAALAYHMTPEISFELGDKTIYVEMFSGIETLALTGASAGWLGLKNYVMNFKPGNYTMLVCGGLGAGSSLLIGYVGDEYSTYGESPISEEDWSTDPQASIRAVVVRIASYLSVVNLEKSGYSSERDFVRDLLIKWVTSENLQSLGFSSHEELLDKVMEGSLFK